MKIIPVSNRSIIIFFVSTIVGALAYCCVANGSQEFSLDFLLFWSAAHLLFNGQNCYDYTLLTSTQLTFNELVTLKMNHFPWVLTFLLPILIFPWKLSVALMAAFNTTQLASLIKNGERLCGLTHEEFPILLFVLTSAVPIGHAFAHGQVGLLITATTYMALLLIQKKRDSLGGLLLSITAIKPQMLYLLLSWIISRSIILRRFKIAAGFSLGVIAASVVAIAFNHLIFIQWYESLNDNNLLAYNGVSLLTIIRLSIVQLGYPQLSFIVGIGIPLLLAGLAVWMAYQRRNQESFVTFDQTTILLFGSIIFAPYLWLHDMSILSLANLFILHVISHELKGKKSAALVAATLILNSFITAYLSFLGIYDYRVFYYPIIVLVAWGYIKYLLRDKTQKKLFLADIE